MAGFDAVRRALPKLLAQAGAAGSDEGPDTEEDVDKAQERERTLLFDCGGMSEEGSAREADRVDVGGNGSEEGQQGDGDGDVHPEHALLRVIRIGHDAEEDKEEADAAGDERRGMDATRGDEADDTEQNEQDAEDDGQLCHD
jgi:hypothetical protein